MLHRVKIETVLYGLSTRINEENEECGQIQEENYLVLTAFLVTP